MQTITDPRQSEIHEPTHTYETLDAELVHKGHGGSMDKRKIGNNTWLVRMGGGNIAVRLHNTDILTYWPDNRVVLNAASWLTVTTKDRMNAFLGWGTISSNRGEWELAVRFRVTDHDAYRSAWVEATVPFENFIALDVRTHEMISSPNSKFTRIDDSLVMREAGDLSRMLRNQTDTLERLIETKKLTKDDIHYSLKLIERYQQERERLVQRMQSLESAMDWASTHLEEMIQRAAQEHTTLYLEQREARENIPGQNRMKDLL